MNKNQFLNALHLYLAPLPEEGRREVLHYYEGCFARGLANGQSEAAIADELGDPKMLAADALGIPYDPAAVPPVSPDPTVPPSQPNIPAPPVMPMPPLAPASPPRRNGFGHLLAMTIMLLFLNVLIVIPIGASLWGALLSFGAAAVGVILTPAAFALDWLANGDFHPAKLFISFAATGVGILLAIVFWSLLKLGWRATGAYGRWTLRTWRGRD